MQFREMLRDEREEGRREGLREGRQEGLREGRQEGLREGRQDGLREGKINATLDSIRGLMKNLKWTSEQAMDALGLSAEEQQKYRGMI